jgi:hypothetical protein
MRNEWYVSNSARGSGRKDVEITAAGKAIGVCGGVPSPREQSTLGKATDAAVRVLLSATVFLCLATLTTLRF